MSARLLDEATARSEICRIGRSFDRGYVHARAATSARVWPTSS